jgi:TRAP transporter 4TM/12TM fusion protein
VTDAPVALSEPELESGGRFRTLTGVPRALQRTAGILAPLLGIAFIFDLPSLVASVSLFPQQFAAAFLALILFFLFLTVPPGPHSSRSAVPLHDWLLGAVSLAGGFYVALFYETLLIELGLLSPFKILLGLLVIVALLEATRRLAGWPIVVIVLLFAAYGRYGYLLPGLLRTKPTSWGRIVNQLYLGQDFLFGTALQTAVVVVFAFVLFGQVLFGCGAATFLLHVSQALMGRFRGGPAKIAVVASALFGTLSGSAVGNVAAVGVVTIPLMKRSGYSATFAGAVEAVSSTGGCIMPPVMGAAAFIMAELLGISYFEVAIAAAVPAALYYLGQFIQIDLRATKLGLRGMPRSAIPAFGATLRQGWMFTVPAAVLVWALFGWHLRPELAALYALASLLLIAPFNAETRRVFRRVWQLLEEVSRGMLEVTIICAAAGLVVGIVSYTGLGLSFSRVLTSWGQGHLLLLAVLTAVASIILGMGMPVTASYLFLAVLAAPALAAVGVPPLLAHLFVFYYGAYSFLTPPVCLAAYAAASLAGAPMLPTAWQAIKLAGAGYIVPFIFLYKPSMVLMGTPADIAWSLFDSVLAVWALAVATEGYLARQLGPFERIAYLIAALVMFVPGWESRVIGVVMLATLYGYGAYARRHVAATAPHSDPAVTR